MKIERFVLGLTAILAVFASQILFTPSAYANSSTPTTKSDTIIGYLAVDCTQHPNATILKNWAKYGLCGYSNSTSPVNTHGSVTGNCGTVSNTVTNIHGGNAQSVVTISPNAISGGMYAAFYAIRWYNSGTGGTGVFSNVNAWSPLPSFNWRDPHNIHTDTGNVNITVTSEYAKTTLLGECTLVSQISASAKITA